MDFLSSKSYLRISVILIFLLTITSVMLGILYFSYPVSSASEDPETNLPVLVPTVATAPLVANPSTVNLVWFTYIPRPEDLLKVSENFSFYILIQGNEDQRDLMIDYGAEGPFIQYLEFESIQDPGSCKDEPEVNQVTAFAGDFCQIDEEHPDWFLHDQYGERIRLEDKDNIWYVMDPGNQEWRAFFLERIILFQASDPNWSGVFLDNLPLTLAYREEDGDVPAKYPTDASYQAAIQGFLQYLDENYFSPHNKFLIGNFSSRKDDSDWTRHLTHLSGAMLEGWAIDVPDRYRPVERWEEHMLLAEETQQLGKTILLVSRGDRNDYELQQFAFASYLLINQGNAYFRYAHGSVYQEVWLYDNYAYPLGDSLGPRYRDGEAWRRDFANGSVMVNPLTHEVEITIN
jgi:hypothetical protein